MAPKSVVWKFFEKRSENIANCSLCKKNIKSAGNTSNLMGHIRNVHKATYLTLLKKDDALKLTSALSAATNDKEPTQKETNPPISKVTSGASNVTLAMPARPQAQQSIVSSFDGVNAFAPNGYKTDRINKALTYMVCKDNQPFSFVENSGFKYFVKQILPRYKLPGRTTLATWVDGKYEELSEIVRSKLQLIENVTLTTDIWSETMSMKSYLGVTAHFGIDIEFHSVTLGVYELDERHTSEYISEKLLETCTEWKIETERVSAVITDNAANMVKAIEISFGKVKHIPCFAHVLNLVAQSAMQSETTSKIVSKIKQIVTFFKQSCIASDQLRKATTQQTKLIQDVATRWNSTFYMLERFLQLKSVVSDILLHHNNAPPMLSGSELSTATNILQLLRPLEAATKEISGDKYCTASKIIPLVSCMSRNIKAISPTDPVSKSMQQDLLKEINKRMGSLELVTPLAIATILDPRFKKLHFVDHLACSIAVQKIKTMVSNFTSAEEMADSDSSASEKSEASFSLWSAHQAMVHHSWKSSKANENLSDQLSIYLKTPVNRLYENPLEIWSEIKIQFPTLYKVAYKYLTLVGSSVPSERLFSKAAQIITQQRNRLSGHRLNKLLFLQSIDKKYWET